MSNDDLERRLRGLEPVAPRPGVREEVLAGTQAELSRSRESGPFDRILARPWPWAAAAVLLAGLFAVHRHAEADHEARMAALLRSPMAAPVTARERQLARTREALADLLGDSAEPLIIARLQARPAPRPSARAFLERQAQVLRWTKGEIR